MKTSRFNSEYLIQVAMAGFSKAKKGKGAQQQAPEDDMSDLSMEDNNGESNGSDQEEAMNTGDETEAQISAEINARVESASEEDDEEGEEGEEEYYEEDEDQEIEVPYAARTDHHGRIVGDVPADARKYTGTIPGTRFADEYKSTLTLEAAIHDPQLIPLLAHVNCSYLPTIANSPTLTELKQHAQSLVVLIKALTVSTSSAFIDNANLGHVLKDAEKFHDGETYDFLNNLNTHYKGPKKRELQTHHSLPLNAALNTIETIRLIPTQTACACAASKEAPLPITGKAKVHRGHDHGAIPAREVSMRICPMQDAYMKPLNQTSLPYAKHENLIRHANEVLELLDHEYSAKGGLLSILPPKEKKEDRKKAEATLLGQLILYMQRLVVRCHDLERLYANATDALAAEAVVPAQTLSRLGPDGRKGRELVYPQDRFVLVNAGEDVFSFLSREFDKKDIADEEIMKLHLRNGTSGEALWQKRGGEEYSRGITALDVVTRYYRIRGSEKLGQGIKTIFMIPAHAEHPGVKVTREMESQPTVVSIVKPVWPERQSILEMKHRTDMVDLRRYQQEVKKIPELEAMLENHRTIMEYELKLKKGEVFALKDKLEGLEIALNSPGGKAALELVARYYTPALKAKEEAEKMVAEYNANQEAAKAARAEAESIRVQTLEQRRKWDQELAAEKAAYDERLQRLGRADEESARVAREFEATMKVRWQQALQEVQELIDDLKSKGQDFGDGGTLQDLVDRGYSKSGINLSTVVRSGGQQLEIGTDDGQGSGYSDEEESSGSGFLYDESSDDR